MINANDIIIDSTTPDFKIEDYADLNCDECFGRGYVIQRVKFKGEIKRAKLRCVCVDRNYFKRHPKCEIISQ